jgi:hypothetical protein
MAASWEPPVFAPPELPLVDPPELEDEPVPDDPLEGDDASVPVGPLAVGVPPPELDVKPPPLDPPPEEPLFPSVGGTPASVPF